MNLLHKTLLALAALALTWVSPCLAQSGAKVSHIGVLANASRQGPVERSMAEFLRGMRDLGHVEGKNLRIEWRFTEGRSERLASMAAELVALKVDVIVVSAGDPARATLAATSSIPIVMVAVSDPENYVRNLARPEANITGFPQNSVESSVKYVELLRAQLPKLQRVAVLVNRYQTHQVTLDQIRKSAKASGVSVFPVTARNAGEIEHGLKAVVSNKSEAIIVVPDPLFSILTPQISKFAVEHRLPTMFGNAVNVEQGGLMAYGVAPQALYYRAATYVDRILKGTKISELPVEFPTKIELTINMKTAKAIGITIAPELRLRADRIIE